MPTAVVNGVRLHFLQVDCEDAGSRDHLVAVHGLATNLAFWYLHYAPRFARRFRVTLFDLRGHGRSEMPDKGYSPADMARDLAALLDHLEIDSADFVTHSFGGVVTMRFAVDAPERVRSLVLADSHVTATRKRQDQQWHYGRRFQPILDHLGGGLDTQDPYFGYRLLTHVARWRVAGAPLASELAELVGPLLAATATRTARQWLRLMEHTSAAAEVMADDGLSLERLASFRFPILAMYGGNSQARRSGTQLMESWPHAEFQLLQNAGHFFPVTRAHEVISRCERFWAGAFERHAAAQPT